MPRDGDSIYAECCSTSETAAVAKLGRSLSDVELCGIRNAGSLMMLEVVDRSIEKLPGDELSADLQKAGEAFASRFESVLGSVVTELESLLARSLAVDEVTALRKKRFIPSLAKLAAKVRSTKFRFRRERLFRSFVSEDSI